MGPRFRGGEMSWWKAVAMAPRVRGGDVQCQEAGPRAGSKDGRVRCSLDGPSFPPPGGYAMNRM